MNRLYGCSIIFGIILLKDIFLLDMANIFCREIKQSHLKTMLINSHKCQRTC